MTGQPWECAHTLCPSWAVTHDARIPHHQCRYGGGLMLPLVRAGRREDLRLIEREDWIGRELVQTGPDGRPVMAAETRRDDGTDISVYAPTATASTTPEE